MQGCTYLIENTPPPQGGLCRQILLAEYEREKKNEKKEKRGKLKGIFKLKGQKNAIWAEIVAKSAHEE